MAAEQAQAAAEQARAATEQDQGAGSREWVGRPGYAVDVSTPESVADVKRKKVVNGEGDPVKPPVPPVAGASGAASKAKKEKKKAAANDG